RIPDLAATSLPPLRLLFFLTRHPPSYALFPYTTLFRSSPSRSPRRPGGGRSGGVPPLDGVGSIVKPLEALDLGLRRTPPLSRKRSEEHTSELQSRFDLVCRLLLEKKKQSKAGT